MVIIRKLNYQKIRENVGDDFYILFFSFLVNSSEFQSHFGLVQPEVKVELGGPTPPRTPSPAFQSGQPGQPRQLGQLGQPGQPEPEHGQQNNEIMRLPVPLHSLKTETGSMIPNSTPSCSSPFPVRSNPVLLKSSLPLVT